MLTNSGGASTEPIGLLRPFATDVQLDATKLLVRASISGQPQPEMIPEC